MFTLNRTIFCTMNKTRLSLLIGKRYPLPSGGFPFSLLLLSVGFLVGSLFASFLGGLRSLFRWDGLVLLALLLFQEGISLFSYSKKGQPSPYSSPLRLPSLFNALKVGLLLGLFVDGFKVGS